jgi:predicted enzyme related to lactoylglutathione lyase
MSRQEQPGVDATLTRHGGLSYLEIPAIDVRQSAAFYSRVLGWNVMDADSDRPKFMDRSNHLLGRWIAGRKAAVDAGLLPYFYVNGIQEIVQRAVAEGGAIVKPIYAEGNLWVATVCDPAGNVIGLWQEQ